MKLPKELTSVTPASKLLALILFIELPIVGFLLGMRHQQVLTSPTIITYAATTIDETASPAPNGDRANWKTYENTMHEFSIKYPPKFILEEKTNKNIQFTIKLTNTDKELVLDIQTEKNIPNWPGNTGYEEIKTLNRVLWKVFAESEYCDAGDCSKTPIIYRTTHNNKSYHFILTNIEIELVDQILSTFKFID